VFSFCPPGGNPLVSGATDQQKDQETCCCDQESSSPSEYAGFHGPCDGRGVSESLFRWRALRQWITGHIATLLEGAASLQMGTNRCKPVGVENQFEPQTQGSRCASTLGWRTLPRWGKQTPRRSCLLPAPRESEKATQTVLEQAKLLCAQWATRRDDQCLAAGTASLTVVPAAQ
jgi:hypothetical protein